VKLRIFLIPVVNAAILCGFFLLANQNNWNLQGTRMIDLNLANSADLTLFLSFLGIMVSALCANWLLLSGYFKGPTNLAEAIKQVPTEKVG
jgi:hypothetical protein